KSLNLSQTTLSKNIGLNRQSISRFEKAQRIPNEESIAKIMDFIKKNKLNITELKGIGKDCSKEAKKREKSTKLNLKNSKELAELIGIILGDGEIKKDGSIRISFDPKKDKNFLYRRVFILIQDILKSKINFESYKRIVFWNMAFTKFLEEDCKLTPGSKFENNWKIPKWCFKKEVYLAAVLRGLFDTDGYFGYWGGSLDILFGRFSHKCTNLVEDIEKSLKILNLIPSVRQSNDGRFKIRLLSKEHTLRFFKIIGTSNIKHAIRFLLWRIKRYEAKIELEGLPKLLNLLPQYDLKLIKIPFLWNDKNKLFLDYIQKDKLFLKSLEIRKLFKWPEICKELTDYLSCNTIAKKVGITPRNVRKWREGIRTPSQKHVITLLELRENLRENAKTNC
ncbi:helix-turn-helix domain-containing protein, partial [Candidatus Woesearchaeota archaeon]|nr:helix-turn-helix domain-containing protein [Candidatus Woesearchaeota archaeon]